MSRITENLSAMVKSALLIRCAGSGGRCGTDVAAEAEKLAGAAEELKKDLKGRDAAGKVPAEKEEEA